MPGSVDKQAHNFSPSRLRFYKRMNDKLRRQGEGHGAEIVSTENSTDSSSSSTDVCVRIGMEGIQYGVRNPSMFTILASITQSALRMMGGSNWAQVRIQAWILYKRKESGLNLLL